MTSMQVVTRLHGTAHRWYWILQLLIPGFVLHELAHYGVGKQLAAHADFELKPRGRTTTYWRDDPAAWRVYAVSLAPLATGWVIGLIYTAAVLSGVVALPEPASPGNLAAVIWIAANYLFFTSPSKSDLFPVVE